MKKIAHLSLSLAMGALLFWACSKNDNDTAPIEENNAPVIQAQTFTVLENATEIGTVVATDEDGDELAFSITANDNALFAIDNAGKISLAQGKALDFNTDPSHAITVQVDDGEETATAQITINLTDTNDIAPVFTEEGYSFEVFEDIAEGELIGTVEGSDPEGSDLEYTITQDESELFIMDKVSGEITLAAGKQLDFEAFGGTEPLYNIIVQVSDGELTADANVGITVKDVPEADPNDPAAFVTTWETTMANEYIVIGLNDEVEYDFTIDWGDGSIEELSLKSNSFGHKYESPGIHTVAIYGDFPHILINLGGNSTKLKSIEQWGTIQWQSMYYAFYNCSNMVYNAKDVPNLSNVTSMGELFKSCFNFNGDLSNWNIQNVTNMQSMLNDSGMSPDNYGATLQGWADQAPDIPQNISFGAQNLEYCDDAQAARDILTHPPYNWNINDAGSVNCNQAP